MPLFRSPFAGYSVKWSPFDPDRLAVGCCQNFGIIGNGKVTILAAGPGGPPPPPPPGAPPGAPPPPPPPGPLTPVAEFDTRDGVYDVAWSEASDSVLAAACGDGSIKLYNVAAPPTANPLASFTEHSREVASLSWNVVDRHLVASGSWDDTVRIWDAAAPAPLAAFTGHSYCVYSVAWCPRHAAVLASASGDASVKIWDARRPPGAPPTLSLAAAPHEILSVDWCKYADTLLATGSVDRVIRLWDVRNPSREVTALHGHTYAVRRVAFSPHAETVLLSASYDMTVRAWDAGAPGDPALRVWRHHSEFATGVDASSLVNGRLASTGWDGVVAVWPLGGEP